MVDQGFLATRGPPASWERRSPEIRVTSWAVSQDPRDPMSPVPVQPLELHTEAAAPFARFLEALIGLGFCRHRLGERFLRAHVDSREHCHRNVTHQFAGYSQSVPSPTPLPSIATQELCDVPPRSVVADQQHRPGGERNHRFGWSCSSRGRLQVDPEPREPDPLIRFDIELVATVTSAVLASPWRA